jgi:hypothetical protein
MALDGHLLELELLKTASTSWPYWAIRRRTCPNKTSQMFLQNAKLSLERNNLVEFRFGGSFDELPTPN